MIFFLVGIRTPMAAGIIAPAAVIFTLHPHLPAVVPIIRARARVRMEGGAEYESDYAFLTIFRQR